MFKHISPSTSFRWYKQPLGEQNFKKRIKQILVTLYLPIVRCHKLALATHPTIIAYISAPTRNFLFQRHSNFAAHRHSLPLLPYFILGVLWFIAVWPLATSQQQKWNPLDTTCIYTKSACLLPPHVHVDIKRINSCRYTDIKMNAHTSSRWVYVCVCGVSFAFVVAYRAGRFKLNLHFPIILIRSFFTLLSITLSTNGFVNAAAENNGRGHAL